MLYNLLLVVEIIVSILLIGIVLIQRTKGQGAGLSFGSGAEAIFGAQMGNVLTRTTAILGIVFLVNTVVLATIPAPTRESNIEEGFKQLVEDNSQTSAIPSNSAAVEVPAVEVPAVEAPAVEAPAVEAPAVEAPAAPAK